MLYRLDLKDVYKLWKRVLSFQYDNLKESYNHGNKNNVKCNLLFFLKIKHVFVLIT